LIEGYQRDDTNRSTIVRTDLSSSLALINIAEQLELQLLTVSSPRAASQRALSAATGKGLRTKHTIQGARG